MLSPLFPLLAAVVCAAPLDDVRTALAAHVESEDVSPLLDKAQRQAEASEKRLAEVGDSAGISDAVLYNIARNLRRQTMNGLDPDVATIERTVIGYEAFKAESYVTSGVFPKRYFGYFDEVGDTAAEEVRLRESTIAIVAAINDWQEQQGNPLRITEAEVAVTYISEGGALHLTTEQSKLKQGFHPVYDVGLDDIAMGVQDYPTLIKAIDEGAGTDLLGLVGWWRDRTLQPSDEVPGPHTHWLRDWQHQEGEPHPYLRRLSTFEEAIAGTALMVLWEKEIADRKMVALGHGTVMKRTPPQQFIIMSLVYNSGILHKSVRWQLIGDFTAGPWIAESNRIGQKRRWPINVLAPADALDSLRTTRDYLDQPTEWLTGYHILQRYGGYAGLRRFTDVFDEHGNFVRRPPR